MPKAQRLEKADYWLNAVGLKGWGDKVPGQLSGGMRRRVGLARAFTAETDILLMDEAFSALDPLIRREMQELLVELQSKFKKTIIFITHDLNEAMFMGDRIAVMRNGRIVQIGTPEDILTDPANDYVAQFVQDVDRARVLTASNVMEKPRQVISDQSGPRSRRGRCATGTPRPSTSPIATAASSASSPTATPSTGSAPGQGRSRASSRLRRRSLPRTMCSSTSSSRRRSRRAPPVVDDQGLLVGVIPRATLLAALGHQSGDGEVRPPAPPLAASEIDEVLADEPAPVGTEDAVKREAL